jgi:hypothetical protein
VRQGTKHVRAPRKRRISENSVKAVAPHGTVDEG